MEADSNERLGEQTTSSLKPTLEEFIIWKKAVYYTAWMPDDVLVQKGININLGKIALADTEGFSDKIPVGALTARQQVHGKAP